jgi:hypothetical protein
VLLPEKGEEPRLRMNSTLAIPLGERVYRAFRLDAYGYVEAADEIRALNDEQAEVAAPKLVDGQTIELWDRDHCVAI